MLTVHAKGAPGPRVISCTPPPASLHRPQICITLVLLRQVLLKIKTILDSERLAQTGRR